MGIFSSIVNAIFGSKAAAAMPGASSAAAVDAPAAHCCAERHRPGSDASATAAPAKPAPISKADVEAIIAKIEADRGVKYNWRQSIVDLMKLLDLDSSLGGAQGARTGARLQGRARRLRRDECVAAQAGHGEARRRRRQGAGQPEGLTQRRGMQRSAVAGAVTPASHVQRRASSILRVSAGRFRGRGCRRNADRSFGENGFGPPVISPAERS